MDILLGYCLRNVTRFLFVVLVATTWISRAGFSFSRRCMNGPESRTGKIILRCTYLADQFQHALSFVDQSLCIFPTVDCNPRARSRRSSGRRASLEVVGGLFLAWSSVTAGGRRARGKAMSPPFEGGVSEETDTSMGRIGE